MAATSTTTAKLIKLRPVCLSSTTGSFSIKFFSSSSSSTIPTEDPKEESSPRNNSTQPKSSSAFTSLLNDVKASIKQQQGNPQSRTPPRFPSLRPSFNLKSNDEVLRNLSEFRRRSDVTPPPASHGSAATQPTHNISLSQMYQQSQASKGQESSSPSSGSTTLKSFLDTLSSTRPTNVNNSSARFPRNNDKLSLSRLRETLNSNSGETSGKHSTGLLGSRDNLPSSIFGKEMVEGDRASANADTRKDFVKRYSHADLGKKLESLRPDKKGDWFSLQELNDRLMKLRQIDKENPELERHSGTFAALRDSLQQIQVEKQTRPMPNINLLKDLGRTPSYMMSTPQEHLVEKYFHPDNMSASEKLKLELEKVRDEFKMSESDCGSARVQVAQLTTKIKHLATVLHKKDKHSRKGLLGMVQKRKTLLKYLRRTDWESYSFVLSKLGLRDNPDYKN